MTVWKPFEIWNLQNYGLIFLNHTSEATATLLKTFWTRAKCKVFVDGFINFVYRDSNLRSSFLPDIVCGDFDSVSSEALEFYQNQHTTRICSTPDQNFTDFSKAVTLVLEEDHLQLDHIIAVHQSGGRLDHQFAIINTLFEQLHTTRKVPVYTVTECDINFILPPGQHKISIDRKLCGETCGLLPVGTPVVCRTEGFQWDLHDERMQFGGLISACNKIRAECETVVVHCDAPLLMTLTHNLLK